MKTVMALLRRYLPASAIIQMPATTNFNAKAIHEIGLWSIKLWAFTLALVPCLIVRAQTTYTLNMGDNATVVATPYRAGINLGTVDGYDSGQIYKNLDGENNFGFEPVVEKQIWALDTNGTATTFSNTNKYAYYPTANFWAGASFSVVESAGSELNCTGTIISNTTGTSGITPAVYTISSTTNQGSSGCAASFAIGDQVIITVYQFPTTESCWEGSGAQDCGLGQDLAGSGKLLTDSTTPYDGAQSLILDVTAGTSAKAGVVETWDNDSRHLFVLLNGTYQISGYAKRLSGNTSKLTIEFGRIGSLCSNSFTPATSWAQFTYTCTFSETNSSSITPARVEAVVNGSDGLGQVEIDDLSITKTSSLDSTNTSIFRDEVVAALRGWCSTSTPGPSCMVRDWLSQNGETMSTWTNTVAAAPQSIATAFEVETDSVIGPRLQDFLNLVKLVNGIPYIELPVTFTNTDAANFVEYMSSTNTTSGWGQVRANQGQAAPWVGIGGVFSKAYISFCNECWNGSFSGQALPFRSGAADFYYDYSNRAKDIYAAMRGDASFSSSMLLGFNMQLGVDYGNGGVTQALTRMKGVGGAPDYVEQADYTMQTISNWQTDQALWGSALEQPYEETMNTASLDQFNQAVNSIQSTSLCGPSGTSTCLATQYEFSDGTLSTCGFNGYPACSGGSNQAIDQTHEDYITAGAGQGIIAPWQFLINQRQFGMTAQNYFGLSQYTYMEPGASVTSKLWGAVVDMGGASSYLNGTSYTPRPAFQGMLIANSSIIGPEFSCSFASPPTYSWSGDPYNGPTGPTTGSMTVPYIDAFCFQSGTTRTIVLLNSNLTTSYTVNFSGTNTPTGTCTNKQFAPSSPDLLNEAATGSKTVSAATTSITASSATCGTTLSLPALSETAISYTIGTTPASTPTFSPTAGTYSTSQSVTISDSTSGATIYYTTDGSTPTSSSAVYSGAITVPAPSETIKAVAMANGYQPSSVGSAAYTITQALAPSFSPGGGSYDNDQSVTMSSATSGASIYYTLNGTTPTTSSTLYTGPRSISNTLTVKAIAAKSGYTNSNVSSATYTLYMATPVVTPATGTYKGPLTVTVTDDTTSAVIRYTTNGGAVVSGSPLYTAPITVSTSETVRAQASRTGYTTSPTVSNVYTILPYAATPTFSVAAGTYTTVQSVTVSDSTSGATIYYTTDGSTPTSSSSVYSSPISVSSSETLKAIAIVASGYSDSAVASAVYTINLTEATPTFSPVGGTYTGAQSITVSTTTPYDAMCFTVDGSTPTDHIDGSGHVACDQYTYTAPINVYSSETLNVVAAKIGYTNSSIGSASYTIH